MFALRLPWQPCDNIVGILSQCYFINFQPNVMGKLNCIRMLSEAKYVIWTIAGAIGASSGTKIAHES